MTATLPLLLAQSPLATVDVPVGYVIGALLIWAITTLGTWAVAARVTSAVLREKNKHLVDVVERLTGDIERLSATIGELYGRIDELKDARYKCENRAVKTYATKSDFTHLLAEGATRHTETISRLDGIVRTVRDSVSKVHQRVDAHDTRLTTIEATAAAAQAG